jgi:hypothetical protein
MMAQMRRKGPVKYALIGIKRRENPAIQPTLFGA